MNGMVTDNQEPESNKYIEEINHEYIIIEDEEDTEVNRNVSTQRDDDNDVDGNICNLNKKHLMILIMKRKG